jgi:3-oxoacyl-[acyl-carrier-protein] synthase-3
MIGIEDIAYYIPSSRKNNFDLMKKFEIDEYFIKEKIGIEQVSIKDSNDEASDLCFKAWQNLPQITRELIKDNIDCIVVVTQNPDSNIPHVSAKVHGLLELKESCACFDISLGCSGFVYALSVVKSFVKENGFDKALLFTADPYSKIVNPDDKNTALLFGDAASVTIIGSDPKFTIGKFNFGTIGKLHKELVSVNGELYMNGRAIFDFAARYVPNDVVSVLVKNNIEQNDVDLFLFHQGSKYIVDTIRKRVKLPEEKVPFLARNYGNTVSSTIPIMLSEYLENQEIGKVLICGFGVGLSWASTILIRKN